MIDGLPEVMDEADWKIACVLGKRRLAARGWEWERSGGGFREVLREVRSYVVPTYCLYQDIRLYLKVRCQPVSAPNPAQYRPVLRVCHSPRYDPFYCIFEQISSI